MSFRETYNNWVENQYFDEKTRQELISIKEDEKEIEDRFYKNLEFGTFCYTYKLFLTIYPCFGAFSCSASIPFMGSSTLISYFFAFFLKKINSANGFYILCISVKKSVEMPDILSAR